MKNKFSFLLSIAAIFGFANQASAVDSTDTGRVSAVVELSDSELQSFLQTGLFKMSIPPRLKNKVNSLILKRPNRFKDDVAIVFSDVDKRSNTIAINIDDSTIEQIDFQPVELKVYESGYTNIIVRYNPGNGKKRKKPSKTDSVELKVVLNDGKSITGRLSYLKKFSLKSGIGKVKVKLDEVSLITFEEDGDLRVAMLNGDTLQGESDFTSVIVNSRWGQERIETEDIASIAPPRSSSNLAQSTISTTVPSNTTVPAQSLSNWNGGQTIQGNAPVSVMPQAINQPIYGQAYPQYGQTYPQYGQTYPQYGQNYPQYGQAYPQYGQTFAQPQQQFPTATGRIDAVPRSPRQLQRYLPSQPVQQYHSYGQQYDNYGQSIVPSQGGAIYGGQPVQSVPMNQVPISTLPVNVDSLMGQPLPMMTPNQANESWLFPQN